MARESNVKGLFVALLNGVIEAAEEGNPHGSLDYFGRERSAYRRGEDVGGWANDPDQAAALARRLLRVVQGR